MKKNDIFILALIILTSVTLAVLASYYTLAYLSAVVLALVTAVVFITRPHWFLYFFAVTRVSLDAVKVSSYALPEVGRRFALSLDGIMTLLLILYAVIYLIIKRRISLFGIPGCRAYILFLVICIFSLIGTPDMLVGVRRLARYASYLFIYVLGVNILDTREKNHKMCVAILISSLIPLGAGFYQAMTLSGDIVSSRFNRIYATLSYPNAYAFYLMIMLIFIITMYFYAEKAKKRFLLSAAGILVFISLILTYTRGAWLGAGFGIGIFVLMRALRLNLRNFILLVVFLSAASLLVGIFSSAIAQRSSPLAAGDMGSLGWRSGIWLMHLKQFLLHPFLGFGIGSSGAIAKKELGFFIAPHNDYLKLLVEIGIFGLLAFVGAIFFMLMDNLRKYRANPAARQGILASGVVAAIFAVSLVFFGDNLLDYDASLSYFWLFIAAGYNLITRA